MLFANNPWRTTNLILRIMIFGSGTCLKISLLPEEIDLPNWITLLVLVLVTLLRKEKPRK